MLTYSITLTILPSRGDSNYDQQNEVEVTVCDFQGAVRKYDRVLCRAHWNTHP